MTRNLLQACIVETIKIITRLSAYLPERARPNKASEISNCKVCRERIEAVNAPGIGG